MKTEVLDLLQKAQNQISNGDLSGAKETIENTKDRIRRPIGSGTNGPSNK